MARPPSPDHDRDLAAAFDGQAARFEKAPVQADPAALGRLVRAADLPADSRILDVGSGPGLVGFAFLEAGHRVTGVDLSGEMVARARARCARFGDRARFERRSFFDLIPGGPFDAAISRYVLHHVADPSAFVRRQVELVRPGGQVVLSDHTTDPDPALAGRHNAIERLRDRSHTRNLTPGAIVDLLASAGLGEIRLVEEPFTFDFDEWFDRGTPGAPKAEVRDQLVESPPIRGFRPVAGDHGRARSTAGERPSGPAAPPRFQPRHGVALGNPGVSPNLRPPRTNLLGRAGRPCHDGVPGPPPFDFPREIPWANPRNPSPWR